MGVHDCVEVGVGVQCEGGWVWVYSVKVGGCEVCMAVTAVSVRIGC